MQTYQKERTIAEEERRRQEEVVELKQRLRSLLDSHDMATQTEPTPDVRNVHSQTDKKAVESHST